MKDLLSIKSISGEYWNISANHITSIYKDSNGNTVINMNNKLLKTRTPISSMIRKLRG